MGGSHRIFFSYFTSNFFRDAPSRLRGVSWRGTDINRPALTVYSQTMPHTRVISVALAQMLKPVSSWSTIRHSTQGRGMRDVRDILLSYARKFLLRSLTTTVRSNRTRRSHRDTICAHRTESSRRALPIMVLAREQPSSKGALWEVNLIEDFRESCIKNKNCPVGYFFTVKTTIP